MLRCARGQRLVVAGALTFLIAGCGGDGGTDPTPTNQPASIDVHAGDGQTARVGTSVQTAPAVIVRDAGGSPVSGVTVTFAVESGGGTISGATATTNANGVAAVGSWTLGPARGSNTVVASAQGLAGRVARFSALSRWPYWTVMVYLAGDNNLAVAGIFDIDEMEAAGVDPEVQVVVQAEFSPSYLEQLYGCDASCFNRPNFNTFRYFVSGQGQDVTGPNGTTTDIGNADMTDPTVLRDFVLWAKQNHPAESYALVLWNHGGGYTGLIEDQTSAGSQLMSIGELRPALAGVGPIDVLDFDMCNMAGYETLVMVEGLADYAVFSEELVPGEGNPYTLIIDGIQSNAAADARSVAGLFVDHFHASYQGHRASTTKSAYEVAGFVEFESALDALAGTLRANLGAVGPALTEAAERSQSYYIPQLKDVVDLLDSLRVRTSDPTLQAQIDALKTQATGSFRVRNRARTGTGAGIDATAGDVSRSTGLNIVLPSGNADDQMADAGPSSFPAYQTLYSGKAWTLFLADWLATQGLLAYTDQGDNRFEGYLVWETDAVQQGADVDLWIVEPNGNLFIPYLGSVTPNGVLTNDSYENATYFEGYLTNRFVQNGTYKFYANLWIDPNDFQPFYDLQYRYDQVSNLTSLYSPNFPQLSTQVSWLSDPDPTWAEVEAGAYTDLQFTATLTYGAAAAVTLNKASSSVTVAARATTVESYPQPTPAQLAIVRRALADRQLIGERTSARAAPAFIRTLPQGMKR